MSEKNKEMNKSISVKLPDTLLEKARQKSATTGISLSFIVRKAIEEWVGEQEDDKKSGQFGSLTMGKAKRKN